MRSLLLLAVLAFASVTGQTYITEAPGWRGASPSGMQIRLRLRERTPPAGFVWGRLEVRYNPEMPWGTVCDDGFTSNSYQAAKVACQTLGYSGEGAIGGSPTAIGWSSLDGPTSTDPIMMDDVVCTESNVFLYQCTWSYSNNCGHSEDVKLQCNTSTAGIPPPTPGVGGGTGTMPAFTPPGEIPSIPSIPSVPSTSTTGSKHYYTTVTTGATLTTFSSSAWSSAVVSATGSSSCTTSVTSSSRSGSTWSVQWYFSSSLSSVYLTCQSSWEGMSNSLRSPAFSSRGYGTVSSNSWGLSCVGCASLAAAAVGLGIALILLVIVLPICCCIIFWSVVIYCLCCKKETIVVTQPMAVPAQPMMVHGGSPYQAMPNAAPGYQPGYQHDPMHGL